MAVAASEDQNIGSGPLKTKGRDPKARMPKSIGTMAVNDAMWLVIGAWLILFGLSYSLRHHNV